MYSMVLMASLVTAGDAPAFGKKSHNTGCTGTPVASCQGYVVSYGCQGSAAPEKKGFLGICKKRRNKNSSSSCHGASASCYGTTTYTTVPSGCHGTVVAAPAPSCCLPVPAPTTVYVAPSTGCNGNVVAQSCGCHGSAAASSEKKGFLGLCKKRRNKSASTGCTGVVVSCYGY